MEKKTKKAKAESKERSSKVAEAVTSSKEKNIMVHGKTFEGIVTKKFPKRVVIEFERMIYVRKYERYAKSRTKIHARLPDSMEKEISIGDLIRIGECRPLSKIIHFIVLNKIKNASEVGK